MPNLRLSRLAPLAFAVAAAACGAETVSLGYSNAMTAVHEYFVDDPAIGAWVQLGGAGGTWNLTRGVAAEVGVPGFFVGTGGAVDACCQAEEHLFHWNMTVAGVTREMSLTVRMTEIANDQYQIDVLDAAPVVFDLGALGLLSVDLRFWNGQMRANTPIYNITDGLATVLLSGPVQGVPLPGTLPLAALALAGLATTRRRAA